MNKIENILFSSMYNIDNELEKTILKNLSKDDAKSYIKKVMTDSLFIENTRECCFENNSIVEEKINAIINIYCEEKDNSKERFDVISKEIADKLLCAELTAKRYEANLSMKIIKGSLVQALIEHDEGFSYILAKIEHENFMDSTDMIKREGLPYKKITLKSCNINMDEEFNIIQIQVSDNGRTISKYWISDFLAMKAIKNNEDNTKRMYTAITKTLSRFLREYPKEHEYTKQKLNHYMSSNCEYKHTDLIEAIILDLDFNELDIDVSAFKNTLIDIPKVHKLDSDFIIAQKAIKKNLKQNLKVSEGIEIAYEGDPELLRTKIIAIQEEGDKVLKIRGIDNNIYDRFKE